MWSSPAFQKGSIEFVAVALWRRYQRTAMLFLQHGESCRQTTLVDGVVPRSHSSVKNFDCGKRGRTHQFYEAVSFEEVFMVGCVSPIAGRSLCDSVSDITAGTVTKYRRVFVDFNLFLVSRYQDTFC